MLSLLSDPVQILEQLTAAWLFFSIEALISIDSITQFLLVSILILGNFSSWTAHYRASGTSISSSSAKRSSSQITGTEEVEEKNKLIHINLIM